MLLINNRLKEIKTMKNTLIACISILFVIAACTNNPAGNEIKDASVPEAVKTTPSDLLKSPEKYAGKTVLVEGLVTHVCRHGGQKLFITEKDSDKKIRITTGNNISEFDVALEGSEIEVQGVFRQQVIDEAYISELEKEAKLHEEKSGEAESFTSEGGDGMENAANLRAQLEASGKSQVTDYWIENINYKVKENED